jgi:hypothetical protein
MQSNLPKLSWAQLLGLAREISPGDISVAIDENRCLLLRAREQRDEIIKLRDAVLEKLKKQEWETLSDDSAKTARRRQELAESLCRFSADALRWSRQVTIFQTTETALELLERQILSGPQWSGF